MSSGNKNNYAKQTFNAANMAASNAAYASPIESALTQRATDFLNWERKAGRDVGELPGIGTRLGLVSQAKERAERARQGIGALALADSSQSNLAPMYKEFMKQQAGQDYAGAIENAVGQMQQENLALGGQMAQMDMARKMGLYNAAVSRESIHNQPKQSEGIWSSLISGGMGVLGAAIPLMSDERMKDEIEDLPHGMETVRKLRPKRYRIGDRTEVGFLAQDVEKVVPEVTATTREGTKGIYYQNMVPILTSAIQDLKKELDSVKRSKKA